jgi:hypothetical protein
MEYICRTGDYHVKWIMPDPERKVLHVFSHMWNLDVISKYMKVEEGLFGKNKKTEAEPDKRR